MKTLQFKTILSSTNLSISNTLQLRNELISMLKDSNLQDFESSQEKQ